MLTDKRYKQLMMNVGMPDSKSLLQALRQCAMESALAERGACADLCDGKIKSLYLARKRSAYDTALLVAATDDCATAIRNHQRIGKDMTDEELNEALAKVKGIALIEDDEYYGGFKFLHEDGHYQSFNYKDPAIFAENVIWLLDNDWEILGNASSDNSGYCLNIYEIHPQVWVCDKDPYKAVALARIKAAEVKV